MTCTFEKTLAYIFDLDGTLYSQKKMHRKMAIELIRYYSIRLYKIKDIYYIWKFRRLRERKDNKKSSIDELIGSMSGSDSKKELYIFTVIDKWMFKEPLRLIKSCAYTDVVDFIIQEKKAKKTVVIYSDYPVKEKLCALGLEADMEICSEDKDINELKPSYKAMSYIVESLNVGTETVIYVGDRYEKDGESAKLFNIKYYDIHDFRKQIIIGENQCIR